MKDTFKESQLKHIGYGGLHCYCCNSYKSDKGVDKKLNRLARSTFKEKTRKLIREQLFD